MAFYDFQSNAELLREIFCERKNFSDKLKKILRKVSKSDNKN